MLSVRFHCDNGISYRKYDLQVQIQLLLLFSSKKLLAIVASSYTKYNKPFLLIVVFNTLEKWFLRVLGQFWPYLKSLCLDPVCNCNDKKWTSSTTQTMSLHWLNNSNQMDVLGCKEATTMTLKANDEKAPDEPPEGSWWTKVSTRMCYLWEHAQQFQGQELAPSSKLLLIDSRLDWKLWIVSAKQVKTNLEWIWASSYSW